jgi:hypothetical protein
VDTLPQRLILRISADSRYKLYVNNTFVEYGPAKGDDQVWFYDEIDIAPWLREGENVLAVEVLHYGVLTPANHSIFHSDTPGLYVGDVGGHGFNEGWKCRMDDGFRQIPEGDGFAPLQVLEDRDGFGDLAWKNPGYDDSGWETAAAYPFDAVSRNISPGNLFPRPIPTMLKIPQLFLGVMGERCSAVKEDWNALCYGEGRVEIPAHSNIWVELDAGELTTGFLSLRLTGGQGAEVKLLTSEGYVLEPPSEQHWFPVKGDRTDWVHGLLCGFTDTFRPSGGGTPELPQEFAPFWWRTFRFVRLDICTGDEPLTVCGFNYLETGYPLDVQTEVTTSDRSLTDIWDISLRSLRRCMQETYTDCPFYEQLQYIMDTRSQILYTYAISADDRLARETIEMFSHARRYDGLPNCSYPNTGPNIIPGFSIYYILMLHDHMMYFGDKSFLRKYLGTVDGILDYFDRHLEENGIVGKLGTVNKGDYWSFIDWSPAWQKTDGMPSAGLKGPITMESLLYVLGLQRASELCDYLGRHDTAREYRERAAALQKAVNIHCLDSEGIYLDGPGVLEYSVHAQIFAILTGTVSAGAGKPLLVAALDNPAKFAQCSVAMYFYLFRALEKVGLYERTGGLWEPWRKMLRNHLTTCVENDTDQRSDCHAWGALALYELPAVTLGVRPAAPGYEKIAVKPIPGCLDYAEGTVITPKGTLSVSWQKQPDGTIKCNWTAPAGIEIIHD